MRTRKVRVTKRKSKAKRGGQKPYEYTNPTSSNLNLNLYSKVGGAESCEDQVDRLCLKSCDTLCSHTETLSKKEYEEKLRGEIAVLKAEIIPLEIDYNRLEKLARDRYASLAHPLIRRGGFFDFTNLTRKPANKKCVEDCHASCSKGKKERCETIYKNTHKTELTREIEILKLRKDSLKANIAHFNHSGFR